MVLLQDMMCVKMMTLFMRLDDSVCNYDDSVLKPSYAHGRQTC